MSEAATPVLKLVSTKPVPILHLWLPDFEAFRLHPPIDESDLRRLIGEEQKLQSMPLYRGVSIDRLRTILRTGVDVEPSDAGFFATSELKKAWEYGEFPKVIQVFDSRFLKRSFRELGPTATAAEIAAAQAIYSHRIDTVDGQISHFSRLPADNPQMGAAGELEYGYYIPGNPWQALKMIIVATLGAEEKSDVATKIPDEVLPEVRAAD